MLDRGAYPHYIDEEGLVESPVRELYLVGWCGTPYCEPLDEIWADVDGNFYPCLTGTERPDLVAHFGKPAMHRAGFAGRFPVSNPSATVHFHAAPNRTQPPIMIWRPSFPTRETPGTARGSEPQSGMLVSVLLPAVNASRYHLFRAIESLRNQAYPHWELLLACHRSDWAEGLASVDPRIRLIDCSSAEPDAFPAMALRDASGEYAALLDQTDELDSCALMHAVAAVAENPNALVVYTDEQMIDECGRAVHRIEKPSFDSEVLLQRDCIGQLALIRTSALRAAGGFRPEFQSSQHWELLVRLSEANSPARICHVPEALYLRRRAPTAPRTAAWTGRRMPHLEKPARIAVFLRVGDGPQQSNVLLRSRFPAGCRFFEIGLGCVYPLDDSRTPLLTLSDTGADLAVFVNSALDHVNHEFFHELARQAARPDCGIAGGAIAGTTPPADAVRSNVDIPHEFFATRMSILAEAAGLATIRYDTARDLCNKIQIYSMQEGLKVLFTPYAVATLRGVF